MPHPLCFSRVRVLTFPRLLPFSYAQSLAALLRARRPSFRHLQLLSARREDPRVAPDTWGSHPPLGSGWRGELAATTPSVISRGTRSSSQTDRAGPTRVDFTLGLWPGLLIENYGPNGPLTDWQRSCCETVSIRKVIVKYRLSRCRSGCPDCWGRPQRIFLTS